METTFSSHFSFDDEAQDEAKICVIGVGGGGGNAINNMIDKGIYGSVEYIAVNTDQQALSKNRAPLKVQTGRNLTKGLGAGARAGVGAEAVEENRNEIEQALKGFDMVFITAGMGGGTGTGGAPVVASIAQKLGILTVAIVTRPFNCEGGRRRRSASEGITLLREHVDTLIVIPNERLLDIADESTSLIEAFAIADDVLYNATRGISDLITVHGLINLDFADVQTTMRSGGTALMGSAMAKGDDRAEKAAIEAISSPLLDGLSIQGARNVLVNITSGPNLGIREATQATGIIQREAGEDVEVIFGTVIDEQAGDELRVTVIATGFDDEEQKAAQQEHVRRTTPLDERRRHVDYKGEDSLRHLDVPAYERRSGFAKHSGRRNTGQRNTGPRKKNRDEENGAADGPSSGSRSPGSPRASKIRRLQAGDLKDQEKRTRSDADDTPAFLRKMMD